MTRNFKKAALHSLDGKWGVGVGVSALFYFVPSSIAFFRWKMGGRCWSISFILFCTNLKCIGNRRFYVFNICTVYRDNWP
ncbi:hypothetical protein ADK17_16445 [Bacillus anthracis]|nr:hypothetical protein ADK17_16445 [Bacillus anthracis]